MQHHFKKASMNGLFVHHQSADGNMVHPGKGQLDFANQSHKSVCIPFIIACSMENNIISMGIFYLGVAEELFLGREDISFNQNQKFLLSTLKNLKFQCLLVVWWTYVTNSELILIIRNISSVKYNVCCMCIATIKTVFFKL